MSDIKVLEHLPDHHAPVIWRVVLLTKRHDRNDHSVHYFFDEETLEQFEEEIAAWNTQKDHKKIISSKLKYHRPGIEDENQPVEDVPILKYFDFEHLPDHLKEVSRGFWGIAIEVCGTIEPGPERSVALRKLLEAKDAAVRAKLHPGG